MRIMQSSRSHLGPAGRACMGGSQMRGSHMTGPYMEGAQMRGSHMRGFARGGGWARDPSAPAQRECKHMRRRREESSGGRGRGSSSCKHGRSGRSRMPRSYGTGRPRGTAQTARCRRVACSAGGESGSLNRQAPQLPRADWDTGNTEQTHKHTTNKRTAEQPNTQAAHQTNRNRLMQRPWMIA